MAGIEIKVIKITFPNDVKKRRDRIVWLSTQAAENYGGLDVCQNKCHWKNGKDDFGGNWEGDNPKKKDMRCCSQCGPGYLNGIPKELREEAQPFLNQKTGFWRPNVGCSLPRRLRPEMCLVYRCTTMEKEAPEAFEILGKAIIL